MILSSRKLVAGLLTGLGTTALIVACGSDDESKFKDPNATPPGFFSEAGLYSEAGDDPNNLLDLYKNDPPAAWCGADAGAPGPIGGTAECPDDKNLPGCECATPGDEQNCWTGLRKNRGLGQCKDGKTVCKKAGENRNVWGPCEGQRLPTVGANGEAACSCFSLGIWKIDNTAPCVWSEDGSNYYSYSTVTPTDPTKGPGKCDLPTHLPPGQATPEIWSKNRLTTDCAGTFTLCYRIRVGDYKNPSPNDCILGESCTLADYQKSNVEQELPDLKSWAKTDSACARKWEVDTPENVSPGYGEMIVQGGQTVRCEAVSNVPKDQEFVFNRVQYCPKMCRKAENFEMPECKECQLKGKGEF